MGYSSTTTAAPLDGCLFIFTCQRTASSLNGQAALCAGRSKLVAWRVRMIRLCSIAGIFGEISRRQHYGTDRFLLNGGVKLPLGLGVAGELRDADPLEPDPDGQHRSDAVFGVAVKTTWDPNTVCRKRVHS